LDLQQRFRDAVQSYWTSRSKQHQKQRDKGGSDTGTRSAVTGSSQMAALEELVVDILKEIGLEGADIRTRKGLEIPGYYRPEKKWDLIVVSGGHLVCAIEFKSQVGPSFGNNFNNRSEEAIGNAVDIWTAYREGRFGTSPRPFLGYFFLLEDCPRVHKPVKLVEPHFKADPVFSGASYAKRYELLCRRLVLERNYDASCLTLATNETKTKVSHPAPDLAFDRFVVELQAAANRFLALP
jgi:hypothetical protein